MLAAQNFEKIVARVPLYMENFQHSSSESFPRLYLKDSNSEMHVESMEDYSSGNYDLSMSLKDPAHPSFAIFLESLQKECSRRGLRFLLVHEGNVQETIEKIRIGKLTSGFHLDFFSLWHEANEPFAKLSQTIQDCGGKPVNSPHRSRLFTDKAASHFELSRNKLGVPRSLVLRPGLTEKTTRQMIVSFLGKKNPTWNGGLFLKKGNGFGNKGVTHLKTQAIDELVSMVQKTLGADPSDSYLLQEEVRCGFLQTSHGLTRPAYWRIIHCLGTFHHFWWKPAEYCSPGEKSYIPLEAQEIRKFRLQPLLDFAEELREISGLDWFSTEICLQEKPAYSKYQVRADDGSMLPLVSIDYFNDQCDVHVQSQWHGAPPDLFVHTVARRFAEHATGLSRINNSRKAA